MGRWEDNIKVYLKYTGWEGMHWIYLATFHQASHDSVTNHRNNLRYSKKLYMNIALGRTQPHTFKVPAITLTTQ